MADKKSNQDAPEEKGKRTELEEKLVTAIIRLQAIVHSAGGQKASKEDDELTKRFRQSTRQATGIEDELNMGRTYEAGKAIEENSLPFVFLYKAAYVENLLGTLNFKVIIPATQPVKFEELKAISLHFSQFLNENGYDRGYEPEDFSAVEFDAIRSRFWIKSKDARMNKSVSPDYRVEPSYKGRKSVVVIEKMPSCNHYSVILHRYVQQLKKIY